MTDEAVDKAEKTTATASQEDVGGDKSPGVEESPKPKTDAAASYDGGMVNDIHQTFIGSHFTNAVVGAQSAPSKRTTRLTGLVTDSDIRALRTFVQPDGFDAGVARLVHERMLVLCGPADCGKRSSALSLLREVTTETLYLLSPHVSVSELAEYDYEHGCGYVVVDRVTDRSAKDSDFEWRLVRDRVVKNGCYLVVTQSVFASEVADTSGHLAWQAPAAEKVLHAHWQVPDDWPEDDAKSLAAALESIGRVRDVIGLAGQLADGKSLDEALSHLDTRILAVVEKWFDENIDDRRRMLQIATLAFTVGVDERTYEAGLLRLGRILDEYVPEPEPDEDVPKEKPKYNLRELLRENELVLVASVPTELGTRGAMTFAKHEYHRHVLAQLWRRMDVTFWDVLRAWLDEIVQRPSRAYEVCAAVGLAELSSVAIGEVLPIADRWARGDCGPQGQRAAVYVLCLMAYDDSLAPSALKIATRWILRGAPTHRWVATMTFIGQLGVRYPHDARRRLWQVCMQSHTVDGNIENVFGEFFSTLVRSSENAQLVLSFVAEKVKRFVRPDARPKTRTIAARIAIAVIESKDTNTRRSSVLAHLSEFPEDTDEVARLLAAVLMHRPLRRRVLKALHSMLEDLARDEERASQRAKALGEALRGHLPPSEHGPLKDDFQVVASQRKGTDIRSLVNAVLDALQGRSDDAE